MKTIARTTRPFPDLVYPWIVDRLIPESRYGTASLARSAIEQKMIRQEHGDVLRIVLWQIIENAKLAPEATFTALNRRYNRDGIDAPST